MRVRSTLTIAIRCGCRGVTTLARVAAPRIRCGPLFARSFACARRAFVLRRAFGCGAVVRRAPRLIEALPRIVGLALVAHRCRCAYSVSVNRSCDRPLLLREGVVRRERSIRCESGRVEALRE